MAEQFKAGEHIGRILLFFALFLDKPVRNFIVRKSFSSYAAS